MARKCKCQEKDRLLTPFEVRSLAQFGQDCRCIRAAHKADFVARLESQYWSGKLQEPEDVVSKLILDGWGVEATDCKRKAFFNRYLADMQTHYSCYTEASWWGHLQKYPGAWFAYALYDALREYDEGEHYLQILAGYIGRGMMIPHPYLAELAAQEAA